MIELSKTGKQERELFRFSAMAGLLSGALLLIAMVFVATMVPPEPTELAQWAQRFPDVQMKRIIENGIYLVGLLMAIPLMLGMLVSLRSSSLTYALTGATFIILGISAMAISSTPHVAHAPLSKLYHAAEATAQTKVSISLMWQATWGVFNAMLYVGFLIVSVGLITIGLASFKSPLYGKGFSWIVVALGTAGLVSAVLQIMDPASAVGGITYLCFIAAVLVFGWKLFTISRADQKHIDLAGLDQAGN